MSLRLLFSFFIFGLSLGSGACLAGCGPALISYLAGTEKNVKNSIRAYGLFSLSRLAVYLILGLSAFFLGQFFLNRFLHSIARPVYITGGILIAAAGICLAVNRDPGRSLCAKTRGFLSRKDAGSIMVFGLLMGIAPCAALISVLASIALIAETWRNALLFTLAFGLGTVVSPLFILCACTGLIPRTVARKRLFGIIGGSIIIITGIRLFMKGM